MNVTREEITRAVHGLVQAADAGRDAEASRLAKNIGVYALTAIISAATSLERIAAAQERAAGINPPQ